VLAREHIPPEYISQQPQDQLVGKIATYRQNLCVWLQLCKESKSALGENPYKIPSKKIKAINIKFLEKRLA